MSTKSRALAALGVVALLAMPRPGAADRIVAWNSGGPGGGDALAELAKQLAPVKPGKDAQGMSFFAGRVLKLIPAVNPSAPQTNPDHWPKIVFEAYGKGGTPKSRRPAILSTLQVMRFGVVQATIDTVDDFSLLLSNRHEIMGLEFGSPRHRQAVFAALDPDGSMGLSTGGGAGPSGGLKEGALMVFGRQGVSQDMMQRMMQVQTNPIDPIHHFGGPGADPSYIALPGEMLEEYARSMRYPGYEPAYGGMAKAALQIFYTLSIATPDLTSRQYRGWAQRYGVLGRSTFDALSRALDYHPADADNRKFANDLRPFMPLSVEDTRRAALEVLAEGPVVPVPAVSHQGSVVGGLLQVISKDAALAPAARRILDRQLAPDPGEAPAVTALYEVDREKHREEARSHLFGQDELTGPAGRALARVGWGTEKEARQIVDVMVTWALQRVPGHEEIDALLRMVARPKVYTRRDRLSFAFVAENELKERVDNIRTDVKRGFGGVGDQRLLDMLDAPDE